MTTDRKVELWILAITLIIAVIALVPQFGQWLFPSQSQLANSDSQSGALPTSTSDPDCDKDNYIRDTLPEGTLKTYIRCPIGEVEYLIQADDNLYNLTLHCPNAVERSISFSKDKQLSEGQALPTFRSEKFITSSDCQVYIVIENTIADQMGYTITQEEIAP